VGESRLFWMIGGRPPSVRPSWQIAANSVLPVRLRQTTGIRYGRRCVDERSVVP
jgi:hypothetical protein